MVLTSCVRSAAQSALPAQKADSLWQAWKDSNLADSSRLNALYRYSWDGYLNSRPDSALYLFGVYRSYAVKKAMQKNICLGLTAEGIALNRLGDSEASIQKYRESIAIAKELRHDGLMLRPLINTGVVYKQRGEYDKALEVYTESLSVAERSGDSLMLGAIISNIGNVHREKGDYVLSLDFHTRALEIREHMDDVSGMANSYGNLATVFMAQGAYDRAVELYFKSLGIYEQGNDKRNSVGMTLNIGNVYALQRTHGKAMEYFEKGMQMAREMKEPALVSELLHGMASVLKEEKKLDRAMENARECLRLWVDIGDENGAAEAMMLIGSILQDMKTYDDALVYYIKGLRKFEAIGSGINVARAKCNLAAVYLLLDKMTDARSNAESSFAMAREMGAISESKDAAELLWKIYKQLGMPAKALEMHELHVSLKDSIDRDENRRAVMQQQFQYDYDKREALLVAEQEKKDALAAEELKRKEQQRNAFTAGFVLMLGLAGVSYRSYRIKKRDNVIISEEKARSEELLLNILPEEVADELKAKGAAEAKLIEQVTVLFTDFKGFTQLSEKLTPQELVGEIHQCFSAFDSIMQRHGVEKIKTIGDAYMAAGGVPAPNSSHAKDVVSAALDIQRFMQEHRRVKEAKGELFFEIRIGVHTGPVVAGIVGVKKFQYDIWGDTVNTASRMESSGEVGKVNISHSTYDLVKNEFNCQFRGEVEAKGKGKMGMWFVNSDT